MKAALALALALAAASAVAQYNGFTLLRVEPTNGGNICVYSNGQHIIKQFRPYSMGYCPFNMPT